MPIVRAHVFVSGRVQGVFFRSETQDIALSLGLRGWVKNLYDGRVEAVFEGEEENVKKAIDWCHRGTSSARVDKVEVSCKKPTGEETTFSIGY